MEWVNEIFFASSVMPEISVAIIFARNLSHQGIYSLAMSQFRLHFWCQSTLHYASKYHKPCYLPERKDTVFIDYLRLQYSPYLSNADLSRTQRYDGLIGLGSRSIDREWSRIGSNTVDTSEGGTVIVRVLIFSFIFVRTLWWCFTFLFWLPSELKQ